MLMNKHHPAADAKKDRRYEANVGEAMPFTRSGLAMLATLSPPHCSVAYGALLSPRIGVSD
jgi:hypothetical protein